MWERRKKGGTRDAVCVCVCHLRGHKHTSLDVMIVFAAKGATTVAALLKASLRAATDSVCGGDARGAFDDM